ncbi:NUDIX hydrolase [Paenibacillus sepulcri]|uniref:NUDIX hydrolase n=1 Tax=Paenibacillus sepulcri TaxID=359917 RepID=UPI0035EA980D
MENNHGTNRRRAYLSGLPTLSGWIDWDIVKSRFTVESPTDESLISNISIIPTVGNRYVMIQSDNGRWELPGGTLEPNEHYREALRREVQEELGANLLDYEIFGHFKCRSFAENPFRAHIPHPHFIRLVGYGEVELVGKPLNPPDAEQIAVVDVVEIEEAVRRLEASDRHDIAELYKLAHLIRSDAPE